MFGQVDKGDTMSFCATLSIFQASLAGTAVSGLLCRAREAGHCWASSSLPSPRAPGSRLILGPKAASQVWESGRCSKGVRGPGAE